MSRLRRPGTGRPKVLLRGAALLLLLLACAPTEVDLTMINAAGDRLHALVGTASKALSEADAESLTRCRRDLVQLRQETRDLKLPPATGELRDTLVVAMDLLVDGLDATAAGVAARTAGEKSVDLVKGREHLVEATEHLEFGQSRLEGAFATLNRYQDLRARLEGHS